MLVVFLAYLVFNEMGISLHLIFKIQFSKMGLAYDSIIFPVYIILIMF